MKTLARLMAIALVLISYQVLVGCGVSELDKIAFDTRLDNEAEARGAFDSRVLDLFKKLEGRIERQHEDIKFLDDKLRRNSKQNWDLIMAILDYLELEREYYQSDFRLVDKKTK